MAAEERTANLTDGSMGSTDGDMDLFTISLSHRKTKHEFFFEEDATVVDLSNEIESILNIPVSNQKIIVPKGPLLKAPFKDPSLSLKTLQGKTLMLMGSEASQIEAVQDMAQRVERRNVALKARKSAISSGSGRPRQHSPDDDRYTFLQVKPLQGLPHPERSQNLLMRLKQDRGIRVVMKKRKFAVALLTEMEPLSHTQSSHEGTSRILGLNRNKGEVIELRLRTDAHDGYRDYKTIRKTLCHELTHNVHSDHDRDFWDLCHQIEREVDAADWDTTGRTIGESSAQVFASEEEEHEDDGGWKGGEFVLGGVRSTTGLSRREILEQAALERQRRDAEAEHKADNGWRPCQKKP